jgi:hypothetical protein
VCKEGSVCSLNGMPQTVSLMPAIGESAFTRPPNDNRQCGSQQASYKAYMVTIIRSVVQRSILCARSVSGVLTLGSTQAPAITHLWMNALGFRFGTVINIKSRGATQVVPEGFSAAEGCLICLEGFSEGSAKQLPCSHMFCKKCIGVWYNFNIFQEYSACILLLETPS